MKIVLSNRPPIQIVEEEWPIVASASDKTWDNTYECQANRIWNWWVKVRQHEDGRTIVYAGYSYSTNWQNGNSYSAKAGKLLHSEVDAVGVCEAINEVCSEIAEAEADADHSARWKTLARECIADLPVESL